MKKSGSNALGLFVACGLACGVTSVVRGQASYFENFEFLSCACGGALGPISLEQEGWVFRNQSTQPGSPTFQDGTFGYEAWPSQSLWIDSRCGWPGGNNRASAWALVPAIANQRPGDAVSFRYYRGGLGVNNGSIELRYSPTGGTSTGSSATDVGDYTTLIATIGNGSAIGWLQWTGSVPGNGRLAFRFVMPPQSNEDNFSGQFYIDQLLVGTMPTNNVPLPQAGQTVHWTLAQSPLNFPEQNLTIPSGGTVIVDPGVVVNMAGNYTLTINGDVQVSPGATINVPYGGTWIVNGTASFIGTPASPVNLTGGPRTIVTGAADRIAAMPGGRVTVSHANLRTTLSAIGTGVVLADHVDVDGQDNGFFTEGQVYQPGGTIALRDATFTNGADFWTNGAYVLVDNITLEGTTFRPTRFRGGQTMYLNNFTARNNTDAPFVLTGYDYCFGPDNTITNNAFPVRLTGAGLARGTTLPLVGNTNNIVHATNGTAGGRSTWANVGLPYRVDFSDSYPEMGGRIDVEPGVTVKMGMGAYIGATFGSHLNLEGLPEAPIVFERLDPAQAWLDIWYAINSTRPRLEHVTMRGAVRAVDADETIVRVESCLFENNDRGALARNSGILRSHKSRYFNNDVGLQSSPGSVAGFGRGYIDADADTAPNWFQGNSKGLETLNQSGDADHARGNYWGHATGPTDPTNPGGQGDATPGSNIVIPYLPVPPDMNDTPPIVRLEEHSWLMEEGDKVILHWTARDNGTIQKFQVWHSTHGENPGMYLLIDDIPGTTRSWEVTVPEATPASNYPDPSAFRVVAIDNSGQEGFDEMIFRTPWLHDVSGGFHPNDVVGVKRPGEWITTCGQYVNGAFYGGFDAFLDLEADRQGYSLGGTTQTCLSGNQAMPPVSTDLARIVTWWVSGAGGRIVYDFTNYFSIRPDPIIGDAPPSVQLTNTFPLSVDGGSLVALTWSASDDESLRSFDLHASYNNGRTWHDVTHDLPGTTRSFNWQLPPSTGIDAVKVRVVAKDLRFQNTSSTSPAFAISGTAPVLCDPIDFNNDTLSPDVADIDDFLSVFAGGLCSTGTCNDMDFNNDGLFPDTLDVESLLSVFAGGACV
jgi:hypothetical protein